MEMLEDNTWTVDTTKKIYKQNNIKKDGENLTNSPAET